MKNKPFKTIDEQIEILERRNLNIKDKNFAKKYLLYNNYYNTINTYSKFLVFQNDDYLENTDFEYIINIHYFDKELKSILFKYIIEAEHHFKSVIAYRYSEKFKDTSYSYLYLNNYSQNRVLQIAKFISSISKIIQEKTEKNNYKNEHKNAILHYKSNYGIVPIWVLINFMTLGQTVKFYSFLDDGLKNKIAKDMNYFLIDNTDLNTILTKEELFSYLKNIVELRNVVAHNNRLFNFKCKSSSKFNKYIHDENLKDEQRQDVYNVILSLKCFLEKNQYIQLNNSIRENVNYLDEKVPKNYSCKVFNSLGFSNRWKILNQNN